MISTSEFRTGLTLVLDGELYVIVEWQHVKPGKGGAFIRTKLRRSNGSVIERTFRSGEKVQDAFIEKRKLQFLYRAGDMYNFMDMQSYEEVQLSEKAVGNGAGFLKENIETQGEFYENKMIALELPIFMDLVVTETEPGVKGDTAKATNKPATLETGATIQVPLFVEQGETIRVDTRTGSYVGRV
jgi:elongation factor P